MGSPVQKLNNYHFPTVPNSPGANKYETGLDLNWKEKKISMKGRGKPVGIVPEGEDWKTSVGPAKYEVRNGNFGTVPPRHKIGLPRREFVDTGPPRIPVKPVDTLGMFHEFFRFSHHLISK